MKVTVENNGEELLFECPGCKYFHQITILRKNRMGSQWHFNGNFEAPTITPSVLTNPRGIDGPRCHVQITDGQIFFYPDSEHSLAGKTVTLPEVE